MRIWLRQHHAAWGKWHLSSTQPPTAAAPIPLLLCAAHVYPAAQPSGHMWAWTMWEADVPVPEEKQCKGEPAMCLPVQTMVIRHC